MHPFSVSELGGRGGCRGRGGRSLCPTRSQAALAGGARVLASVFSTGLASRALLCESLQPPEARAGLGVDGHTCLPCTISRATRACLFPPGLLEGNTQAPVGLGKGLPQSWDLRACVCGGWVKGAKALWPWAGGGGLDPGLRLTPALARVIVPAQPSPLLKHLVPGADYDLCLALSPAAGPSDLTATWLLGCAHFLHAASHAPVPRPAGPRAGRDPDCGRRGRAGGCLTGLHCGLLAGPGPERPLSSKLSHAQSQTSTGGPSPTPGGTPHAAPPPALVRAAAPWTWGTAVGATVTPRRSRGLGPDGATLCTGGLLGLGGRGRGQRRAAGGERGLRAGRPPGRQRVQAGGLLAWWVSVAGEHPPPAPPLSASGRTGALALVLASSRANGTGPCDRCSRSPERGLQLPSGSLVFLYNKIIGATPSASLWPGPARLPEGPVEAQD